MGEWDLAISRLTKSALQFPRWDSGALGYGIVPWMYVTSVTIPGEGVANAQEVDIYGILKAALGATEAVKFLHDSARIWGNNILNFNLAGVECLNEGVLNVMSAGQFELGVGQVDFSSIPASSAFHSCKVIVNLCQDFDQVKNDAKQLEFLADIGKTWEQFLIDLELRDTCGIRPRFYLYTTYVGANSTNVDIMLHSSYWSDPRFIPL